MSYAVVWKAEADADFARLLPMVASHVLDEIDRFAVDPVNMSRPSHFPYLPGKQLFRCEPFANEDGVTYFVVIFFTYAPSERAINIEAIARSTRP